jgi:hypothetical protein
MHLKECILETEKSLKTLSSGQIYKKPLGWVKKKKKKKKKGFFQPCLQVVRGGGGGGPGQRGECLRVKRKF